MSNSNNEHLKVNVLSRNSSRSYKAKTIRSSAELDKTLRDLDREFHTNMSKILSDEYELKNSEELKRAETFPRRKRPEKYLRGVSADERLSKDDQSFSGDYLKAKLTPKFETPNLKVEICKEVHDIKQICHLPSIIEEKGIQTKQNLMYARLDRTPLPPLPTASVCHPVASDRLKEFDPLSHRAVSKSNADLGSSERFSQEVKNVQHPGKSRQRSLSIPVTCCYALSDRSSRRRNAKASAIESDSRSIDARSENDWEQQQLKTAWNENLVNCRYIRSRSASDVLDVDSIFGSSDPMNRNVK